VRPLNKKNSSNKKNNNGAANGFIPKSIRLSCALRYFAGGAVDDIAVVHGISNTEVHDSVWFIVDAVNTHMSTTRHSFPFYAREAKTSGARISTQQ